MHHHRVPAQDGDHLVSGHPRRTRSGAKLIIAAILGAALAVVLLVTMVGRRPHLGRPGRFVLCLVRQIPAVAPGMILVFALFAILGVGVGSVLTNQVAAIIVSLGGSSSE